MSNYSSEITAWYEAIQYRAPPASELASFEAQLTAGIITTAQAVSQIEASSYTQNYVDPVIREYQAAFGRVPDLAGVTYWVGQVASSPNALASLSVIFANSTEFMTDYAASATTPASSTLVQALYTNILGRPADAAGLAYWSNSGLDAAQLLQAFAQSAEYITDTAPYIVQYQNDEVAGTAPTTGSLYAIPVTGGVTTYTIELGQAAVDYTISGTLGGSPITGTLSSGSGLAPITGTSNIVINAPYGLNDFQSINLSGINNVLNANYTGGASQTGLNIQGVQTWNINAAGPEAAGYSGYPAGETPEVISFSGDAAEGNVISGLTTVNFNDNSSDNTLLIGDNSEPVQEPNGANGFTINVSNAVGYAIPGSSGALINGVDVDIAAQAFTGKDTINVSAYIVGGFPQLNGSYQVPALETGFSGDPDNYNPNWSGFLKDAFGISAGASASSLTTLNGVTLPPTGAVGFQTWDIYSAGAKSVGSVNILALGNEGSWNATTINLTDDGSTTFLFATALSDSLTTDWQNIQTINLSGTSGQVIITGAETDAQESSFQAAGGGGLLTSDTTALETIKGGTGNSFYDLSSLTLAGIQAFKGAESYDGGHGTKGNSEIAFNNFVVANASATSVGTVVNISNIQVLDDTGGLILKGGVATDDQGGVINMSDFAGLDPLNANYDLLSGTLGNLIGGPVFTSKTVTYTSASATPDVAPEGYQLLQLLDTDGSTANVLGANLTIADGFTQFAINMLDVADGTVTAPVEGTTYYNFFHQEISQTNHYSAAYTIGPDSSPTATGDNGDAYFVTTSAYDLYSAPLETLTGYTITIDQESPVPLVNVQNHLKLWIADDGVNVYKGDALVGTIFDSSAVTIDNYTTADIYLPYESVSGTQNWVVLGSQDPTTANGNVGGFVDQPVVTVPLIDGTSASVNFYDNTVDNGGSPPGGADNLVLGVTNFTTDLAPVSAEAYYDPTGSIGYTTVVMDATSPTAINDYGHGSLEIGATNATTLNAQSTSHLIMDLPGVPQYVGTNGLGAATGIIVEGSLTGQNLIQGSSGVVVFDTNGHFAPANALTGPGATGTNGVLEGIYPFQDYSVGNDTLTGGVGSGAANAFGNTGDNFFPEGGNDTVNLSHAATNTAYDTVWVGQFDVSSTVTATSVLPHYIYGQAVTDIVGGVESYVDGYGPGVGAVVGAAGATGSTTSLLTVTGFQEGNTTTTGDVLAFDPQDWAVGTLTGGHADNGLVNAFTGATIVTPQGTAVLGENTYIGTSAGTSGGYIIAPTTLIEDGIQSYANAAQLVKGLTTANVGDIGGLTIGAHATEHVLIAYDNSVTGGVTIDDVTITNTSNTNFVSLVLGGAVTSNSVLEISAVDMVNIVGTAANPVTLGNLGNHNVEFFHG